jgi:hypothetical protein
LPITSSVCAPPLDQDLNTQVFFALVSGEGAEIVFRDPWMTVLVKGVVACEPFSARVKPPGLVLSVSYTVRGSSRTDFVSVRPPESVAVRRNSR